MNSVNNKRCVISSILKASQSGTFSTRQSFFVFAASDWLRYLWMVGFWRDYLKGSYDAFLKIIILCIWCNRICWHALMFKKHIIFKILYIIVGPLLVSVSILSQTRSFLQSPSFRQAQSALIGQLAQCIVTGRTPQALVGNVTPLSIMRASAFKNKCKNR